jgi:hypothetical protein
MIKIKTISSDLAQELCRNITADLPDYFGLPEVNEHYAMGVCSGINFAAKAGEEYVGLLSINFPYPENASILDGSFKKFSQTRYRKTVSKTGFPSSKNSWGSDYFCRNLITTRGG